MRFQLRRPAVEALVRAVEVYPRHEEMVKDVIGRLNTLGEPETALRLAKSAEANFPANSGILVLKGEALQTLGRDREAAFCYRSVLLRDPHMGSAALGLATSLRNQGDIEAATATALEGIAVTSGLDQAGLYNELGRCEQLAGRYDAAFDAIRTSGRLLLDTAQARAVDSKTYLSRLASYHADLADYPAGDQGTDETGSGLVFLLGFPRSGTTLLESILTAPEGIASSGEAPMIDAALAVFMSAGVGVDGLLRAIYSADASQLQSARAAYMRKLDSSYGSGHRVFIDKQPLNTLYAPHIRLLFPGARILFCVRDPRDVCLSCFFQWFALNGTNKLFLDWRTTADFYARTMDYWLHVKPLLGNAACQLRYEDLVADLPGELRRLTAALGLPWDEAMLAFREHNRDQYFTTPSNRDVRSGLRADRQQRWKNYPREIAEVADLLTPAIRAFGYPP